MRDGRIRGSCCCGAVAFELSAPPSTMGTCHCSRCRKLGASTFVFVGRGHFALLRGHDAVAALEPAPPYRYRRTFCRQCGTALGEIGSTAERFPINAQLFDDALPIANGFHEFVADEPAWSIIGDDAPRFDRHPPSD